MEATKGVWYRRGAWARAGVSSIALLAMGVSTPVWAAQQAEPSPGDPDAVQSDDQAGSDSTDSTIVVTGRRRAIEAAIERKRRSETIIDSVVADEAGRLPDNSITEVLQRVSGVSIVRFAALGDPDHFSVEGSGIQVRGLSGVASRLNGREIFSANSGRSLLWGDVTPELMAAVDVYKASTADLIEGGTGGQVDLRTKLPFDFSRGWHIQGTGEISMGDLAERTDIAGSFLVSNRWETSIGEIGLLVDLAYSRFSSTSHFFRMEPYFRTRIGAQDYFIPGGYDYGEENFRRRRTGIYAALQWAPNDDLTFTGTFFQSRYQNRGDDYGAFVTSQSLAVNPATSTFDDIGGLITTDSLFVRDTGTFLPSGGAINSGGNKGVSRSNTVTRDLSFAFAWAPSDGPLSIRGALQRVDSSSIVNRFDVFRDVQFPTSFGLDLTGSLPLVTVPDSAQATFANPASYSWSASMPHNEDNDGRLEAANLDAEYTFEDSFFRSVKAGVRWARRTERDFNNSFNWSALGRGWNGDPQMTFANSPPGDYELHVFDNFFHGQARLPGNLYFPSFELVNRMDRDELHRPPPEGFCGPAFASDLWWNCSAAGPSPQTGYGGAGYRPVGFVLPNDQTDYMTETFAGYGLVRFGREGGLISGNVGARIVRLENESTGYFQQTGTTFIRNGQVLELATRAALRSASAAFTRVLPSVNLQLAPDPTTRVRFAYNITMDNPTFLALRANGSLGVDTTDNPDNTPTQNFPPIFSTFTTDSGNPQLRPTMSNNFDLSAEWYPRQGAQFHLAMFYKRITNLPIYSVTQQPVTIFFADGSSEEALARATDYSNATEAATVKGFEVGGRMFLDMLPGFLGGFGVEGNYTFVDSKNPGDIYRDIDGIVRNDAPVQGMSRHNFNITLLYERNPISARIAYSWRSRYLQSTNSNGTNPNYNFFSAPGVSQPIQIALPIYGDDYGTLDAGVRFRINDNISFSIQGTNLLNAIQRTVMGGYPNNTVYIRSWFQSDRRINFGVNLAF